LLQAAREVGGAKAWELLTQAADSARELGDAEMVLEICAVAEAMPADTPAGPAAQAISGFGAVYAGDQERGLRLLERAVAAAEASSDPRDMITIGFTASWLGRHEQAERLLDQAAALARAQGAMETLCHALAMRAPQLGLAQRFDDAAVAAAEAVRLCRELGFENRLPVPLSILAITNATRGQVDDARRLAEEAHRLGLARGSGAAAGTATWALAVLDVTAGRWEQALARFERIARPAPGVSTPFIAVMVAPERVEMARRVGRIDVARTALADFEAWAAQMPAPWPQPVLECCRALVADGDEATARYQRALERAADARPLDLARIRLLYGEHLRRERRRVDARVQLRAALDGFERLNAVMWAERARAELRASGETARRRDPSTLGQLTPQELQVGQLVASGLSNKEVAAQLFLSTRTIEAHLRSVFSKLEVTSRTQLARLPQFGDPTDASTLAAAQAAAHE
jgi:ATP/maltotriose-dependent transcriptional regulator MalT